MSRSRSLAGALQSGVVINEDSADVDFRVESNGQTHKLFVNGGEDVVCFGFETPETVGGIESGVQIEGTDYAGGSLSIWRNANDDAGGYLQLGKSRGTAVNSDTIVQDNDDVGIINFIGADGTDRAHPIASIRAAVDGTPGNNDMPGRIEFMTTADGGTSLTERMRIDNLGNVGIGSSRTDRGLLNVNYDNTGDAFSGSHIALTYDVSPTDNNSKAGITYATSDSDNYGYFQGAERTTSGQGAFVLRYHNNSAGGTKVMEVDSNGAVSKFLQPAFLARPSGAQNNVTEGSGQTVVFGTEVFDQGSDFSSNTFTAPVTGRYQLNTIVYLGALNTDADYTEISILTSNRNYHAIVDPGVFASDPVYWAFTISVLADMDANDTSTVRYNQVGGVAQTDIKVDSFFSGYLVA